MPCDVCASVVRTIRFNLTRTRSRNGRTTTRGAGSIYLCEGCWTLFARPRMKAVRTRERDWTDQ